MKITKVDAIQIEDKPADQPGWRPIVCRVYTDTGLYGDGEAAHAQNGKYQKHGEMVQGNPHLVRRTLEGHSRPPGQMERLLPVLAVQKPGGGDCRHKGQQGDPPALHGADGAVSQGGSDGGEIGPGSDPIHPGVGQRCWQIDGA